ncbi:hypothetical protein AK812_SmicGene23471 [Symbiodinium microadriaticum]|uniref:Uncharacterized protein n=1 Tax=Symbiodinium microadriaticum TaxID=2951 RepID=A0A1Q9DH44_SYMMI|nr:hypothetical protein AK812_SmicGene23471 [Symbiodinium microadriaticum]
MREAVAELFGGCSGPPWALRRKPNNATCVKIKNESSVLVSQSVATRRTFLLRRSRAPLRAIVENSCGLTWGFEIYHSLQQNCCDFAATSLVLAEEKTEKVEGEEGDEELGVEPTEGLLSGNEERDIRLSFRSARAAQFSASWLLLESRDAEGLNSWQQAAKLSVAAESFAVDAVIEPDPREVALDFGTVLVHSSVQRTFDIVNRGKTYATNDPQFGA